MILLVPYPRFVSEYERFSPHYQANGTHIDTNAKTEEHSLLHSSTKSSPVRGKILKVTYLEKQDAKNVRSPGQLYPDTRYIPPTGTIYGHTSSCHA